MLPQDCLLKLQIESNGVKIMKNKYIALFLSLGLPLLLTGCDFDAPTHPSVNFDSQEESILNSINTYITSKQSEYSCYVRQYQYSKDGCRNENIEIIYIEETITDSKGNTEKRQILRSELQAQRVRNDLINKALLEKGFTI